MPQDTDVTAKDQNEEYVEQELVIILSELSAEWPNTKVSGVGGTIASGTQVVGSDKVIFVMIRTSLLDPYPALRGMLLAQGLDWEIMAMGPLRKRDLYEPEFDENDEPTGEIVEAAWDLPPTNALEPFLQDVQVGGTPEAPVMGRPTLPVELPAFAGCIHMVVPAA
jgi:hypothetical protein